MGIPNLKSFHRNVPQSHRGTSLNPIGEHSCEIILILTSGGSGDVVQRKSLRLAGRRPITIAFSSDELKIKANKYGA